jgi:hypothetical protein
MFHVAKAVVFGGLGGPSFDTWPVEFNGEATIAAHQVVVVARPTLAVEGFAGVGAEHIDFACLGHGLQGAVNGGEANPVAFGS